MPAREYAKPQNSRDQPEEATFNGSLVGLQETDMVARLPNLWLLSSVSFFLFVLMNVIEQDVPLFSFPPR